MLSAWNRECSWPEWCSTRRPSFWAQHLIGPWDLWDPWACHHRPLSGLLGCSQVSSVSPPDPQPTGSQLLHPPQNWSHDKPSKSIKIHQAHPNVQNASKHLEWATEQCPMLPDQSGLSWHLSGRKGVSPEKESHQPRTQWSSWDARGPSNRESQHQRICNEGEYQFLSQHVHVSSSQAMRSEQASGSYESSNHFHVTWHTGYSWKHLLEIKTYGQPASQLTAWTFFLLRCWEFFLIFWGIIST